MSRIPASLTSLVLAASLATAASTLAAVPSTMSYQGTLQDQNHVPITTAQTVVFAVYADSLTPTSLWSETRSITPDQTGYLSLQLGDIAPLTASTFSGPTAWLGVKVANDPEMTPRLRIGSVPYALHASSLDGSTGGVILGSTTFGDPNGTSTSRSPGTPPSICNGAYTQGDMTISPLMGFKIQHATAQSGYVLTCQGTSGCAEWMPAAAGVWSQSGSNLFPTTLSNNVGVGTNAPTAKLHVDNQGVGLNAAAQNITFKPSNTNGRGLEIVGTQSTLPDVQEWGAHASTSINNAASNGSAEGILGMSNSLASYGGVQYMGSYGLAKPTTLNGTTYNYAVGGFFQAIPTAALTLNNALNYVGGIYSSVSGTFNNTPLGGAIAGVIGVDAHSGAATAYAGWFSGNVYATGVYLNGSDIRWKKNIHELSGTLDKIGRLRGVTYDWRRDEFPAKHFAAGQQIGVIAQEIEKEFPQLVQTDGNGFKSVDYPHLTAVLLEAVKELRAENSKLAQTAALVQSLDAKLTSLAGAVKVLTSKNAALPTSGTATTILVPAVGPASSSVTAAGSAH